MAWRVGGALFVRVVRCRVVSFEMKPGPLCACGPGAEGCHVQTRKIKLPAWTPVGGRTTVDANSRGQH